MIFTCAALLRLLGRNLLDHAGMFSFKLKGTKNRKEEEEEKKVKIESGRRGAHIKEVVRGRQKYENRLLSESERVRGSERKDKMHQN